jgi:hypothetical protein
MIGNDEQQPYEIKSKWWARPYWFLFHFYIIAYTTVSMIHGAFNVLLFGDLSSIYDIDDFEFYDDEDDDCE